jgi:hypothetical protein
MGGLGLLLGVPVAFVINVSRHLGRQAGQSGHCRSPGRLRPTPA